MEFRYKIPAHLAPYLGDMNDKALEKLTTMLFEFAINHRMLDYPKLYIERQVDDVVGSMSLLLTQNDKMYKSLTEEMKRLASQVERMSMVRIESSSDSTNRLVEVIESLEDGGEEDYFSEIGKQPTGEDTSTSDLVDELLA